MSSPLQIEIVDPDPLVLQDKQHAVRFTTVFDDKNSSSNVIHLSDGELLALFQASADRINATLVTWRGKDGDDNSPA